MQCEQIRNYLDEYAAGELPGYKMAWVAQHLAGCGACREESREAHERVAARRRQAWESAAGRAEVAATAPAEWAAASISVQRPVPVWLRRAAALAILLLLAGGVWFFLRKPAPRPSPPTFPLQTSLSVMAGIPAARPESLVAPFTVEIRGDVALRLESITEDGEGLHASVRFQGRGLLPPGDPGAWVGVADEAGEALPVRVHPVTVDARGLSVGLHFRLPVGGQQFAVAFGQVSQVLPYRYTLFLPDPTVGLKRIDQGLEGAPEGMTLERYGIIGDMLHVYLATGRFWPDAIPALFLQDQAGNRLAPAAQDRTTEAGYVTAHFQYALPKELPLPVQLVGDGYHRKQVGPWKIAGSALSRKPASNMAGDSLEIEE